MGASITNKRTILIVDDEHDVIETLGFMLKKRGYSVTTAFDSREVLEKAKSKKPDLIVLDLMMPYIDGFEVCKKIKNDEELKKIPVIALTARSDDSARMKAQNSGVDDYILKPFSLTFLIGKINGFFYV